MILAYLVLFVLCAHVDCAGIVVIMSPCLTLELPWLFSGVMMAVDCVTDQLKAMSKPVTTPEEIAQVEDA